MRRTLMCSLGLVCLAFAPAMAKDGQAAPRLGEDVAAFPDRVLTHPTYDLPTGWTWAAPTAEKTPSLVADVDGDGKADVVGRIVKAGGGAGALVIYLGKNNNGGRYTHPIVVSQSFLTQLEPG